MLKGLPASGKSTYAKELVADGWKRVNKDDLRAMIDCSKWGKEKEKDILELRDITIIHYLDQGYNVVVDDTNLNPIHESSLREIAEHCEADFDIKIFDTPVSVCIERDLARQNSVGADVILRMYNQFIFKPVPYNGALPDCYIFDIDGTLAKMGNRSPYDWSRVGEDSLNEHVALILDAVKDKGAKIIIMTGRDASCHEETAKWLDFHDIDADFMGMRDVGDKRADAIVKREIYEENIKDKFNVLGVFDDRNSVIDLWRSLGLTCFQVNYGAF